MYYAQVYVRLNFYIRIRKLVSIHSNLTCPKIVTKSFMSWFFLGSQKINIKLTDSKRWIQTVLYQAMIEPPNVDPKHTMLSITLSCECEVDLMSCSILLCRIWVYNREEMKVTKAQGHHEDLLPKKSWVIS